jgi:hypothetical protein
MCVVFPQLRGVFDEVLWLSLERWFSGRGRGVLLTVDAIPKRIAPTCGAADSHRWLTNSTLMERRAQISSTHLNFQGNRELHNTRKDDV